jgi:Flp pilus assembly secretin CpaC
MFFRSNAARQNRSELLVVVTPRLIDASATAPTLPTGEPNTWQWMGPLKSGPRW